MSPSDILMITAAVVLVVLAVLAVILTRSLLTTQREFRRTSRELRRLRPRVARVLRRTDRRLAELRAPIESVNGVTNRIEQTTERVFDAVEEPLLQAFEDLNFLGRLGKQAGAVAHGLRVGISTMMDANDGRVQRDLGRKGRRRRNRRGRKQARGESSEGKVQPLRLHEPRSADAVP